MSKCVLERIYDLGRIREKLDQLFCKNRKLFCFWQNKYNRDMVISMYSTDEQRLCELHDEWRYVLADLEDILDIARGYEE